MWAQLDGQELIEPHKLVIHLVSDRAIWLRRFTLRDTWRHLRYRRWKGVGAEMLPSTGDSRMSFSREAARLSQWLEIADIVARKCRDTRTAGMDLRVHRQEIPRFLQTKRSRSRRNLELVEALKVIEFLPTRPKWHSHCLWPKVTASIFCRSTLSRYAICAATSCTVGTC